MTRQNVTVLCWWSERRETGKDECQPALERVFVCVSLSGLCSFNCAPLYIQMSAASVVRVTLSSGNNVNSTNQTFNLFLLCGTVLLKEKKRFFMLLQN